MAYVEFLFTMEGRQQLGWGVKLQNRKRKIQSNIFKITFFESRAAVVRQLTKAAIFIATPIKRHLGVHFTKVCFFCQFVDRKVVVLMPKYYLLAGDAASK